MYFERNKIIISQSYYQPLQRNFERAAESRTVERHSRIDDAFFTDNGFAGCRFRPFAPPIAGGVFSEKIHVQKPRFRSLPGSRKTFRPGDGRTGKETKTLSKNGPTTRGALARSLGIIRAHARALGNPCRRVSSSTRARAS